MPSTAPARVTLRFEVLSVSLETVNELTAVEQGGLRTAGDTVLYGTTRQAVLDLLRGPLGHPDVDVDAQGIPEIAAVYAAVRALTAAYNTLANGTRLILPDPALDPDPPPHCVYWVQSGDGRVPVYNWGLLLQRGGTTDAAIDLGAVGGLGRQVLAMAHVAIAVPGPL